MNNYQLQKEASDFRLKNGIGACEPIRMKSWLPKLGVLALFKDMSDDFSGMAIKTDNHKFVIINSKHRVSKQHFTIAHELYHLFIQENFTAEFSTEAGKFNKKNKIEYEADMFAAYLLLPEECLLSLIPKNELAKNKITLITIVKIEQYFACSRMALLIRLSHMDLIDFSKYQDYTVGVRNSAVMLGYDTSLYDSGNDGLIIGDYGPRAKKLFDDEKISESHFINLMNDIGTDIQNLKKDDEQE